MQRGTGRAPAVGFLWPLGRDCPQVGMMWDHKERAQIPLWHQEKMDLNKGLNLGYERAWPRTTSTGFMGWGLCSCKGKGRTRMGNVWGTQLPIYGLGTGYKCGCFEKESPRDSSGETGREQTRKTFVVVGKGLRLYPRSSPIYSV